MRHMTAGVGVFESPDQGGRSRYLKYIAAGHFQENQKIFPKNEGDDAHICKILTKYFMYILSMLKFVIACLFSKD